MEDAYDDCLLTGLWILIYLWCLQFLVASASCQTEFKDAVEQTMEQIDVIYRFLDQYSDDFQIATSSFGT